MPMNRCPRALPGVALLLLSLASGCVQSSSLAPRQYNTPEEMAAAYLDDVLEVMTYNHFRRESINWADVSARARQAAVGARTIPETFPAIRLALQLIGDGITSFETASGDVLFVPNRTCAAPTASRLALPASIGYIRVAPITGTDVDANRDYAQHLQDSLGTQDRAGVRGWVVDLRGNSGGNMWPMLAGVGPLIDHGIAGYFVGPSSLSGFEYRLGAAWLNATIVQRVTRPQILHEVEPHVAVLTDGAVSGSGEAIAVAFRMRNFTRSFGTATCGLPTVRQAYSFGDGSRLQLAVLSLSDRTRAVYSTSLTPDEVLTDDAAISARVVEWMNTSR